MNYLFDLCVAFLYVLADLTGTTYKQINVILFVFLHPALTVYFWYRWRQARKALRLLQPAANTMA